MIFRLSSTSGQPLYLQLMEQVQHAVESGVLRDGEQMPGIRSLAEELVVSHNTIAKAYSELQHMGLLDLRHGSGAFISAKRRVKTRTEQVRLAQLKVAELIETLNNEGFTSDEMRRLFDAKLLDIESVMRKR